MPQRRTLLGPAHPFKHVRTHSAACDRHLLPTPGDTGRGRRRPVAEERPRARDNPGRVEDAPKRERGGAAHGSAVAERRRDDDERARPRGERPLLERRAQVVDDPRREWPERAAEDDGAEVEEVEGRGERDAQRAPGLVERLDDARGTLGGAADELLGHALRPARPDGDPGGAGQRLLADERLDAAVTAARTRVPVDVDGDVPELAAVAVRATEQPAPEHDPAADPDLAEDADEVVDADRCPGPVLRERREVGLVLDVHGHAEPGLELRRDGDPLPAEVRGEHDGA